MRVRPQALMLLALLPAGCATAAQGAELTSLQPLGVHGIGLAQGREPAFVLEALVTWGGAGSATPRRWFGPECFGLGSAGCRATPLRFLQGTWQIPSPFTDNFSARFTGDLVVPTDGEYTLYVSSDDGARAWVGDQQVIDAWVPRSGDTSEKTIHLTAGRHPIRVEYFEQGGQAQVHVEWQGPGFARQVIPAPAVTHGGQPGWNCEYFTNLDLREEPRVKPEEAVDFNWGDGGPEAFGAGPTDVFLEAAPIGRDAALLRVLAPPGTYIGLVVHDVGTTPVRFQTWGDELVALAPPRPGELPAPCLRVRALSEGAILAATDPSLPPGFWTPAPGPAIFVAGLGELPEVDLDRLDMDLLQAAAVVEF